MKTIQKVITFVLVVSLLALPNLSCTKTDNSQTTPEASYTLFTPISTEYPAIDNPTVAWTYNWQENKNFILEARTAPRTDNQGNCYFVGRNGYFYSIDSNGEARWILESFQGGKVAFFNTVITKDQVIVTEEGVIVLAGNLGLISLEGESLWEKESCTKDYSMSPNGTLFCFTKKDKLIGIDSKGQTMWSLDVPKNCLVDGIFFDTDSNGYFFVVDVGSSISEPNYSLLKVSPTGELIWKNDLPLNRLDCIVEFLPNNTVQDTFLIAYTTLPYPEKHQELKEYSNRNNQEEKIVKAYNLNYELLWEKTIPTSGVYQGTYAIDEENNFYTYFNEHDYSGEQPVLTQGHITCYSKEGVQIWNQFFDNGITHCPILDEDNNLYFWLNDSDYKLRSITSDGDPRWKLQVDQAYGCKYPIALSPNGEIYTTSYQQNLLFCVK